MDLLSIAAADPTVLPLWGVFLFAVGMYPVGMLFGCLPCCTVCQKCCRDEIGQVVIDWNLEAGEDWVTIKTTPWSGQIGVEPMQTFDPDGVGVPLQFILTGATSGARILVSGLENEWNEQDGQTYSPNLAGLSVYAGPMGGTGPGPHDFVNGEAVTVTPVPSAAQVDAPDITAVVDTCPVAALEYGMDLSFSGTPGSWQEATGGPDLKVLCRGDEGTVIFDVEAHDDTEPPACEREIVETRCTPYVNRKMCHATNQHLLYSPFWDWNANKLGGAVIPYIPGQGEVTAEESGLQVSVGVMAYGARGTSACKATITATATTTWRGFEKVQPTGQCTIEDTYTITANDQDCSPFDQWDKKTVQTGSGVHEDQLVTLTAKACFGQDCRGRATAPVGAPGVDDGPITAVEVLDGGSGYAVKGRVEPTITLASATGEGAEIEITWAQFDDQCDRPLWKIDTAKIGTASGDDGGKNYVENELLTVEVSPPVFEAAAASIRVSCEREEPEVSLVSFSGSGADLTVAFTKNAGPPPTWSLDTITVVDGGSGYSYDQYAYFDPATVDDFVVDEGFGPLYGQVTLKTEVSVPTLSLYGGTGTSAVLSVGVTSNGGTPETWGISSTTISDGGGGYEVGDVLSVLLGDGDVEVTAAVVTVSTVDGTGAITGLSIDTAGAYYHDDGVIESVVVDEGGHYYRATGEIESLEVLDGGAYYEEDAAEPALVADVEVVLFQVSPSAGTGAEISATVDDDPASATFGQITGLTIDKAGDNYLAIRSEPGVCTGPGGLYRSIYTTRYGTFFPDASTAAPDELSGQVDPALQIGERGFLFERACPNYTYEVTIQPAGS